MSSSELVPLADNTPTIRGAVTPSSNLSRRPQILILGNVTTGATDLWRAVTDEANARGIEPDDIVEIRKYTNNLTDALYGVNDRPPRRNRVVPKNDRQLAETASVPGRTSTIAKAIGWVTGRSRRASELEQIAESDTAPIPAQPSEERTKTLPRGVVVFPEMRFHDGISPSSVTTPHNEIEAFCAEHNVPIAYAERSDVAAAIGEMLTPPALPPADENQA